MNSNSEQFYDRLTFLYPVVDLFLKPQKRKFIDTINSYPSGRLLEIGVGNGSHLRYYNRHQVIGIDTSKKMIARARMRQKNDVELLHMNGETLGFQNETFDYVVLSHVIAVVEDADRLLEQIHRVLKSGGTLFILNHFTPDNWLKHLDNSVEGISKLLCFKSVFHADSLDKLNDFTLKKEINAALFSYFKILIYEKHL